MTVDQIIAALICTVSVFLNVGLYLAWRGANDRADRAALTGQFAVHLSDTYKSALKWYAEADHWRSGRSRKHSRVFRDRGSVARAALRGESIENTILQLDLPPPAKRERTGDMLAAVSGDVAGGAP